MNLHKLPKGVLCNLIARISYAKDKQYKEQIATLVKENEQLHGYLSILCQMDGDLFQFRRCSYDENNPCDAAMCCDPSGRFYLGYYKYVIVMSHGSAINTTFLIMMTLMEDHKND